MDNIKLVSPQKLIIEDLKYMVVDRDYNPLDSDWFYKLEKMFKRGEYVSVSENALFQLENEGKVEFVNV